MAAFNAREKQILSSIGKQPDGRILVAMLKRRRDELLSVDSIDGTGDYGAQVEGRKLFKTIVNEFISAMQMEKKPMMQDDNADDDFE